MTQYKAYVPISFLNILTRYIDEQTLEAKSLRKTLHELSKGQRVDTQTFSQLLDQIYQLTPLTALGLRIGAMAKPEDFGLVGNLLTSCSTLKQALIRYGRYQTLVLTDLAAKIEIQGKTYSHQWMLRGVDNRLLYEFGLIIFITLYQSLINRKIAPVSVALPIKIPNDINIYQAILGCPVEFNSPTLRVNIPTYLMLLNISTSDPSLLKIFDQQARFLLTETKYQNETFAPFLLKLREQILVAMKDGDTRASTVCVKMGFSLRSFYRKLSNNDHNYRSILADSRCRLAKRYLVDGQFTSLEIAFLLGYSEQSAFIRAFKEWMGITPGEYLLLVK
ncbi:AraC family transcriptional regulator [Glaciecola sp. 33A]|uniref:AraC family transcriptional regulator n=1 Tax=Glaciecola sp. 33A TaxID=2057807 RepID=UPI000C3404FA|nr:AraC family transcriptional regulator [Glaciecola sp. 33A]PKI03391.1 AraC family transcriptional regulator [Glaciecola sp. 33A]